MAGAEVKRLLALLLGALVGLVLAVAICGIGGIR
jgi:uncharacterized membrane protein YraQ (UPF0718 family)